MQKNHMTTQLNHKFKRIRTQFITFATIGLTTSLLVLSGCSSGKLPDPTPLNNNYQTSAQLTSVWRTRANDGNNELQLNLQPVINQDTLYSAGNNGHLTAIDLSSGKPIWQVEYKNLPFSSDLSFNAANQALYIGTNQGQIVKINKDTGKVAWTKSVPSSVIAAPAVDHDYVFVKTINDALIGLNSQTGKELWDYQETNPALSLRDASNMLLTKQKLYVGFASGTIANFKPSDGSVIWQKRITPTKGKTDVERMVDIDADPVIDQDILYLAAYQTQLTAVDLANQAELWHYQISSYQNFALDQDAIYLNDESGVIYALNKITGQVIWKQTGLKYRYPTAPLSVDNYIIVADKFGYAHVLNKADGSFATRTRVDSDGIRATPMVYQGKATGGQIWLIFLSNDGHLYAYQLNKISQ